MNAFKCFYRKKKTKQLFILIIFIIINLLNIQSQSQVTCLTYYEYFDQNTSTCSSCQYNCLTCLNSTTCALCADQYYLNSTSNRCQKCQFGCKFCTNSTSCTTCNIGLYINSQGECLSCSLGVKSCSIAVIQSCHEGYFLLGGICAGCLDNCKICEDFVTCTQCMIGYYLSSTQQSCILCSSNCQICSDSSTCQSCAKGYKISSNQCVLENCSIFPFCIKCTSTNCNTCEQGKYLKNGQCRQGGSILCQQAVGPEYTDCQVDDYGCPDYAISQNDPITGNSMGVCTPQSATQQQQYIYGYNIGSNCVSSTCGMPFNQKLVVNVRKAFYKMEYNLNLRMYKNSINKITIKAINSSNLSSILAQSSSNQSISLQLSKFNQAQSNCSSCPYGQRLIIGSLTFSSYNQITLQISSNNGSFTLKQYIFIFSICKIQNCQICISSVDCSKCISPYFLQLVVCVLDCDAGFYKYNQYCLLQCPKQTYPIRSSYQCIICISPCLTCQSISKCLSCVDEYYLEGTTCVTQCLSLEYFGNSTTKQCQNCPNPCQTCSLINNSEIKCLSCVVGYWYNGSSCIFQCPIGLYSIFQNEISQCQSCLSSCTQCYIENFICDGCTSGYLLYDNFCNNTSICNQGYFIDKNNVCSSCQYPCATCSNNAINCKSCLKGALFNNTCVILCPDGYFTEYTVSKNVTCIKCTNNCLTCLNTNICLSCITSYYLYKDQCLNSCPDPVYYPNNTKKQCTLCQAPCKTCTSATSCLSCSTGYLDSTQCTLSCNSTSYINSNFQCALCPTPCIQCYSSTKCSKCLLPNILYGKEERCITKIQCQNLGKYVYYSIDAITKIQEYGECKQCTYPCQTCSNSAILCSSCSTGYLLVSDLKTCVEVCPAAYYQSSDSCLKCDSSCYECSKTSTNCTSCSSGRFLHTPNASSPSTCVQNCPDFYYGDNQLSTCMKCVQPCAKCYNIYFCKSCLTGILYNKICISTCPDGTIYNATLNECSICTNNCLTCSKITSNCTSCISGYFYVAENNTCSTSCPTYYYKDSFRKTCERCISPCKQCITSLQCSTCVSGYYYYSIDNGCYRSCPQTYYQNISNNQCTKCNMTICQACDITQNNCTACAIGYYYDSTATSNNCVQICPVKYYKQPISRTCKLCVFPCTACQNTTYCTSCQANYKLYLNKCYSSCPIGYYYQSTIQACTLCSTNCLICSSSNLCLKCNSLFYVQNGKCVSNCSIGLYKGKQDITNYDYCLACPNNCIKCLDYNSCEQCVTAYYLFNGLCLTECPILHYATISDSKCYQCPQNCVKCINATYCTECINSYLYKNLCYQKCPSQTYIFNQISCKPCVSPCKQCTSQYTCVTCIDKYFYYSEYCITKCPKDVWYYPHNDSCGATCPYNKYQAKMICYIKGCGGYLVEYQNYCLQNCPQNYYVSLQQSCASCDSNKQICNDLFVADFDVLKSDKLTLSLYFSQQIDISNFLSLNLNKDTIFNIFKISFKDENQQQISMSLTQYQLTSFNLKFIYSYQSMDFISVSFIIPYIKSLQSSQSIFTNKYQQTIYYYNNYSKQIQSFLYTLSQYFPLFICILILILIIINLIFKTSYFLQILDFGQLIAACLYLQIQYPIILEKYLESMLKLIFTFMPKLINKGPYTFSSSKFIFYNIDTSFTRVHLMTFLLFLIIFIIMIVIIVINHYKPQKLITITNRIKYRLLNDFFSIFTFPLLLFAFSIINANIFDKILGFIVILLTLGFIIFLCNLIINAKEMGQLQGLLSDYQPVSSKLGLMYTPFAYIRRYLAAFVFCIFPQKPLATLTLLLIFTILILICLFFYQPFTSQITDYVSIFMECMLILFILFIVIIGLDVLDNQGNNIVGVLGIVAISLGLLVGVGWLIYLTVNGVKKYCKNPDYQSQNQNQQCVKGNKSQGEKNSNKQIPSINNFNKNNLNFHQQSQQSHQQSAHNFMGHNKNKDQDIYSDSRHRSNKEQFKHWNDQDQEQQSQNKSIQKNKQLSNKIGIMRNPPEILMKMQLKDKAQEEGDLE